MSVSLKTREGGQLGWYGFVSFSHDSHTQMPLSYKASLQCGDVRGDGNVLVAGYGASMALVNPGPVTGPGVPEPFSF